VQDHTHQCVLQIQANLGEGHVNIINAYEAVLTETHLALVMEYAACGSLTSFVANRWQVAQHTGLFLSEDEARFFFRVSGSEQSGLNSKCNSTSENEARFIFRVSQKPLLPGSAGDVIFTSDLRFRVFHYTYCATCCIFREGARFANALADICMILRSNSYQL
jgi:hypothetical protein